MKMVITISPNFEIEWFGDDRHTVSLISILWTDHDNVLMNDSTEAPVDMLGKLIDEVFARNLERVK